MGEGSATFWIDFDAKKKVRHTGDGHYELILTLPSGRELYFPLGARLDRLAHWLLD
jgi:hypothetical protein